MTEFDLTRNYTQKYSRFEPGQNANQRLAAAHPTPQSEHYKYSFTVFTPTYNRSWALHRAYESLMAQTYHDFEWLIIDDGSTDNTHELVAAWRKVSPFPIRYFYYTNQGKYVTYNIATNKAQGRLFVCLDSDDRCVPESLERFKYHWDQLSALEQSQLAGIECSSQDPVGRPVGTPYPASPMVASYAAMRQQYRVIGEKWSALRTEVMREFPFPEFPDAIVKYVPLDVVWSRLSEKYPIWHVEEPLRIYYVHNGAQDQLTNQTRQSLVAKHPLGFSVGCQHRLNFDIGYFRFNPKFFLAAATNYARAHFHLNTRLDRQFKQLRSPLARLLWLMVLPLGFGFWQIDRWQSR